MTGIKQLTRKVKLVDLISDLRSISRSREYLTDYRAKILNQAADLFEDQVKRLRPFRYYITDLQTGEVSGTDSTQRARLYSASPTHSVVDANDGIQIRLKNNWFFVKEAEPCKTKPKPRKEIPKGE